MAWLQPRSASREDVFRERVLRSSILILTVLATLSFLAAIFVFRDPWTPMSFPTIHVVAFVGFGLAGYFVTKQQLLAAGWTIVFVVIFGSSAIIVLAYLRESMVGILVAIPAFMFVPIVAVLVLEQKHILPVSLLAIVAYGSLQIGVTQSPADFIYVPIVEQIVSVSLLLLIEGVLLRQLRIEFDERFEAMRDSLAEAEFARQQAEADRIRAEEADRAKSLFLANMSHELRTPLNAIIGYDEAMLAGMAGEFTDKQRKLLGHIQTNSRRLLMLINDVLDLSKIESGSLEVYLSLISPGNLVRDTVASLQSLALEKNIRLEVFVDENLPELVLTDGKKVEQIVTNLVSNAIKFTAEGHVYVSVHPRNTDSWQIVVEDSGVGMPPQAVQYIFEPFRQVDGSITREYKGTGLGLAITKRLVETLLGDVHVDTEEHVGSTFYVTLPLRKPGDLDQGSS